MPFSIQAVPIYSPTNSIEGFIFLHTLWSKPDEKEITDLFPKQKETHKHNKQA